MSAKWRRSLAWDDQVFPSWAWPVKALLRALSSIWLGVSLLVVVAFYGVLASVPIGLLALGLTWAIYLATLALPVAVGAIAGWVIATRVTRERDALARAAARVGAVVALGTLATWAWLGLAWPALRYEPATGGGLRLFAGFVEHYKSTTLRRLPAFEMTELEFYSWWPLRVVLMVFVVNMVVATVRRIEFTLPRAGVLMVHAGIVLIALGSIYYQGLKKEGDVLLRAGPPGVRGGISQGAPEQLFYDNTAIALYVGQRGFWEQRPLSGVPRYNDYTLDASAGISAHDAAHRAPIWTDEDWGEIDLPVPSSTLGRTDADIDFRVVGYASYATTVTDWVEGEPAMGEAPNPLRIVFMHAALGGEHNPGEPMMSFVLMPNRPAERVADNGEFALEYFADSTDERWGDLTTELPPGTTHALIAETPDGERRVVAVQAGSTFEIDGTRCTVRQLLPSPPFPIITPGYEGATSSLAIIEVAPPGGEAYERWVYHRYPELTQDILEPDATGRPTRRDPDPALRLTYLDCDQMQVFFDDRPDGTTRAAVRVPGGLVRTADGNRIVLTQSARGELQLAAGGPELLAQTNGLAFVAGDRWDHAVEFERPIPTPAHEREARFVGTHDHAWLAVAVTAPPPATSTTPGPWRRVVWLPFSRYLGVEDTTRTVTLADGREVELAFGRAQHPLGFEVSLLDFEMIPYTAGGPPRDFRSRVRVSPIPGVSEFEPFEHDVSLNAPLRAPHASDPGLAGLAPRLMYGLDPNQFKFSQAGWDPTTWNRTSAAVEAGQWDKPAVSFTILAVGNNPGIHVIALGAVLMGIGIPYAFYVKPLIIKRRAAEAVRDAQRVREAAANGPKGETSSLETEREEVEVVG